MEAWIDCGASFIKADVIRWKEADYGESLARYGRKGKPVYLGEREVVAEVLAVADSKQLVSLLVRECRVLSKAPNAHAAPKILENGKQTKRKLQTLLRHGVQRRDWQDGARSFAASVFLSNAPLEEIKPKTETSPSSQRRRTSTTSKKRRQTPRRSK